MNNFKQNKTRLNRHFAKDESGAVTVDWVVLTAALVGIGVTMMSTIRAGIEDAVTDIRNELTSAMDS